MTAPFKLFDGTEASPGMAFTLEPSTGLYREAAGIAGFSVLGTKKMSWGATNVNVAVNVPSGTFTIQTENLTWLFQGNTLSGSGITTPTIRNINSIFGEDSAGVLTISASLNAAANTGQVTIIGAGPEAGKIEVKSELAPANPGGVDISSNNAASVRIYTEGLEMLRCEGAGNRAIVMPQALLSVGVGLGGIGLGRVSTTALTGAMYEMHIAGVVARAWYLANDNITRFAVTNGSGVASATQLSVAEQGAFNVGYDLAMTGPAQLGLVGLQGQSPILSWFQNSVYQWGMGMAPNDANLYVGQANTTGFVDLVFAFDPSAARTFRPVTANGANLGTAGLPFSTVYASNPLTPSDARLKDDIVDLDYGLEQLLALRPITFRWKDRERLGHKPRMGFAAQDVLKALPLAVEVPEDADTPLAVCYTDLIAPLVAAVQSLHSRLAAVEAR
jgi:hypothetical protein